jgi:hypothetical protein
VLVGLGKLDFGIYGGGIWSILFELLGFWHHDNIFFSRKRMRAALHYIKKRVKGKSPNNTTNTHRLTHTPPVSRITFAPVTKLHKATTTKAIHSKYRGGGQSRMIALEPLP